MELSTRRQGYHIKRTLVLAYPIMISQASHILIGLSDTFFVGHMGAGPLAGVALGNVLFYIVMCAALGVTFALTPMVAKADGEGDAQKAASYFYNALYLFPFLGIACLIVGYGISFLLPYMGQEPEVVAYAQVFLGPFLFSLLFIMVYQAFKQFIEGLGFTKPAMIINLSSVGINIVLVFLLTQGWFGLPKLGVFGIGLAGLIDRFFMVLMMGSYVLFHPRFKEYRRLAFGQKVNWSVQKEIFNFGWPISGSMLLEVGCFGGAGILAGHFGKYAQASHQVALQMASATFLAASGIASASSIRVGNFMGQRNYSAMRQAGMVSIVLSGIFMAICGLSFILLKDWLPSVFTEDPEVIRVVSTLLIFAAIFQVSDGVQATCQGALRGVGDVKVPALICFVAYWITGLPLGYAIAIYFDWGVYGIWTGLCTGLLMASILLFRRFERVSRPVYAEKLARKDASLVTAH